MGTGLPVERGAADGERARSDDDPFHGALLSAGAAGLERQRAEPRLRPRAPLFSSTPYRSRSSPV